MDQSHDYRNLAVGIEASLRLTKIRVSRLRDFHDEGEAHFKLGLKDLETEADLLTPEDWDEFGEFLIEQRDDLEELRELKRNCSVVGLFTALEMFLRRALLSLHRPTSAVPKQIWKELRAETKKKFSNKSIDEMKGAFNKIGVPIAKDNPDWQAIMGIKLVRNCITHYGGRPDEEMAEKTKE